MEALRNLRGDRGLEFRPGLDILQIPDKKNIELRWIENCGHSMLVQYPEKIGKIIFEFIETVNSTNQ